MRSARVRPFQDPDLEAYLELRAKLWPDALEEHRSDLEGYLGGDSPWIDQILVAVDASGVLCGFVELRLRDYAEGSRETPVPFLEGWYVEPEWQRQGVGRALVRAAEVWALEKGFRELGSNCLFENKAGQAAHRGLGFQEVEVAVQYLKPLGA